MFEEAEKFFPCLPNLLNQIVAYYASSVSISAGYLLGKRDSAGQDSMSGQSLSGVGPTKEIFPGTTILSRQTVWGTGSVREERVAAILNILIPKGLNTGIRIKRSFFTPALSIVFFARIGITSHNP